MTGRTSRLRFAPLIIGLGILVIVGTFYLTFPWFLSSDTVKSSIERQLSKSIGRAVSLRGGSSISVRPYLGVTYTNVRVASANDETPLAVIEGLEARVGFWSTLLGNPSLSHLKIVRPRLAFVWDEAGKLNWLDAPTINGSQDQGITIGLGTLEIVDGIVDVKIKTTGRQMTFTSVDGSLDWSGMDGPLSATLSGVWNGEPIKLTARAASLEKLLGNGESDVEGSLEAKPITASFEGVVDAQSSLLANGALQLSMGSPRRALQWLGRPIPLASTLGAVDISGTVSADANRMSIEEAVVSVQEFPAQGRMQVRWDDADKLTASGTLAFNDLVLKDLDSILAVAATENGETGKRTIHDDLFAGLDLDFRISASSFSTGPLILENAAATVLIREGEGQLDIGQATIFDGTLVGSIGVKIDQKLAVDMRLGFNNILLDQVTKLPKNPVLTLVGRGDAMLKLQSQTPDLTSIVGYVNGEGTVKAKDGSINGIDLAKLAEENDHESPISGASLFSGSTDYDDLDLHFSMANGVAIVRNTKITSSDFVSEIGGRIDLGEQTLALRGKVVAQTGEDQDSGANLFQHSPFYVGGTTSTPLFVGLPAQVISVVPKETIAPSDP